MQRFETKGIPLSDANALTGLEQLRALVERGRGVGIADTMGFTLTEIEEGRAVFEGTPGPHVYNPLGSVHGGYAAAILDSACGCAVHARLAAGQGFTTLELKVSYLKAMSAETGLVRAVGTVISMGRRTAFAEARLTDGSGRLLATATSTLLVLSQNQ